MELEWADFPYSGKRPGICAVQINVYSWRAVINLGKSQLCKW